MWVVAEGVCMRSTDGGRLRLVEYRDYVADSVRRLFGSAADLQDRSRTRQGRLEIRAVLGERGIARDEAAERLRMHDADDLGLPVHIAWSRPLIR